MPTLDRSSHHQAVSNSPCSHECHANCADQLINLSEPSMAQSKSRSGFTKLSPELRNRIYELCLTVSEDYEGALTLDTARTFAASACKRFTTLENLGAGQLAKSRSGGASRQSRESLAKFAKRLCLSTTVRTSSPATGASWVI